MSEHPHDHACGCGHDHEHDHEHDPVFILTDEDGREHELITPHTATVALYC